MNAEFEGILRRISATLGQGEEAIPFRRGVRLHIRDLALLRDGGLTWDQIARKLTSRGVRHRRGQVISSHQLRTVYALLVKQGTGTIVDRKMSVPQYLPARSVVIAPSKSLHGSPGPGHKLAELLKTRIQRLELDD